MAHTKFPRLFIPGPVECHPDVLKWMGSPSLSHRSSEFRELYTSLTGKLKKLLFTQGRVFVITSSGTGAMEAAIRNCVQKKVLATVCGAFSERWWQMAGENGKASDKLEVEWGKAITPELVDAALAKGGYDTVTCVHNESSTGVMNPIDAIGKLIRQKYPDVLFCVDTVSSMAGAPVRVDDWGLDVCVASSQKAWGLPAGIAIAAVSERALARAKTTAGRGHYFDFVSFAASDDKQETPNTPSTSHFVALDAQCDKILAEGIEARFARHRKMSETTRAWAKKRFALFAQPGYESWTLTCIANTTKVDVEAMLKELMKRHNVRLANGYGKLKDKTFRIAHMADTTEAQLAELLGWLDAILDAKK